MATFLQNLEVKMIVKEVEIQDAAKRKIDDMTRLRLGLPATGPVAFPAGAREATAAGMKSAVTGGGIGGLIGQITTLTTGIFSLAAIFMMAIQNSKIIQVFMSTIGKALGLLVDVILMPFLPIFMIIMVGLFKGIMEFYKWWKGAFTPDVIKNIESIGTVLKAGLSALFNLTLGAAFNAASEIYGILKWLWDLATSNKPIDQKVNILAGAIDDIINDLLYGKKNTEGVREPNAFNFVVDIIQLTPTFWLWSLIALLMGNTVPLQKQIDIIVYLKAFGDTWLKKHLGDLSYASGWAEQLIGTRDIGSDYAGYGERTIEEMTSGSYQHGGIVKKTGPALVHKGETVIPAGKGGITVNITGQFKSDEDMYRKFVDRLRQEQWRTNV